MKSIDVRYFAMLREATGKDQETLSVPYETYADLYDHLQEKYRFTLPAKMIQLAVDDEFSSLDTRILDGARVVFIPPVAGG